MGTVMPGMAASGGALAGVVLRPVANLYSTRSLTADVVTQALYGAPLEILEKKRGWYQVRMEDDYRGWIPAKDVRRWEASRPLYGASGNRLLVKNLFAHIYFEPSVTSRAPMLTLPFEARLEASPDSPKTGRWVTVRLVDGRIGFVQRGDIAETLPVLPVPELAAFSKRFLNLPYTWGGTSSFGYDCSGFTQMLYRQRGIRIPRDADDQAAWEGFQPVDRNSLQPGDLLYFGENPEKITHTGFYLGDGLFIHATTHEQPVLQISRIGEEHWQRLLVAVRRPK